ARAAEMGGEPRLHVPHIIRRDECEPVRECLSDLALGIPERLQEPSSAPPAPAPHVEVPQADAAGGGRQGVAPLRFAQRIIGLPPCRDVADDAEYAFVVEANHAGLVLTALPVDLE